MRATRIFFLALASACAGPEAPDAALCTDLIQRLCAEPVCEAVPEVLPFGGDCEVALRDRTGCDDPGFRFTQPTRARVLECRAPLLRSGSEVGQHPACADVEESLSRCPDLVGFLNGEAP